VIGAVEGQPDAIRLAESFTALYQTDGAMVLRFLRAFTLNEAEAQDLCSDTFRRAWQAWPRFKDHGGHQRSWLLRIARNVAVDRARRRRLEHIWPGSSTGDSTADPGDTAADRLQLEAAVRKLKRSDRELVALRAGGLTHAEIAQVQGRTEQAVKVAWHRTLQQLRSELGEP